jgi:hypothetical protein
MSRLQQAARIPSAPSHDPPGPPIPGTGNQAGCPGDPGHQAQRPRILTVVLKATRGDPQVKVPAPGFCTGSHPKWNRRHGQPAPIVPALPAPQGAISQPGRQPHHTASATPASRQPAAPHQILGTPRPPRREGFSVVNLSHGKNARRAARAALDLALFEQAGLSAANDG